MDLIVDSLSLYRSMVTTRDPTDLSMRRDITGLRELYGSEHIHKMRWIKGTKNPADALTKRNAVKTGAVLTSMLSDGRLGLCLSAKYSQNSQDSGLPHNDSIASQEGEC